MEGRMAGQGWSCGVHKSVAVKMKENGSSEYEGGEEEVTVGTATRENVEVTDWQYNTCSHLMFTSGYE